MKKFFANISLLARVDPVRLFFIYLVIWIVIEVIFYNIEKLLGVTTVYRWYDSALTFILISIYTVNIKYLLDLIKSKF